MGITLVGYSPFYGGNRLPPAVSYTSLLANPLLASIGRLYGRSAAQVLVVWSLSLGVPVNPRTANVGYMNETVDAARDFMDGSFVLDETEMSQLSRLAAG